MFTFLNIQNFLLNYEQAISIIRCHTETKHWKQ